MNKMFYYSNATTINLSTFDISKVTNIASMFVLSKATELNLDSFNTLKVTDMEDMFWSAKVKTIYASDRFITDNVTNSQYKFYNAFNLVGDNGTKCSNTNIDKTYARIDTASTLGYFTLKS